ncbi:MAG: hypothetical protein KDA89_20220, partial [Planctomycetaceae bacterium]|nr:hypothetical protein [Planctomycetaceae bacterium]
MTHSRLPGYVPAIARLCPSGENSRAVHSVIIAVGIELRVVATTATVIPVSPDRLPGPLPPTLNPSLVVSVQAPGASNFDVPAPITFPNLEGLSSGEKSLIFSFDHDAGELRVNGTGTVSDDGSVNVSDAGVGILAPGCHLTQHAVLRALTPDV